MNIPNASPFSFPLESDAGTPDSPYLMFIGFVVRNPVTDKHTVKYRPMSGVGCGFDQKPGKPVLMFVYFVGITLTYWEGMCNRKSIDFLKFGMSHNTKSVHIKHIPQKTFAGAGFAEFLLTLEFNLCYNWAKSGVYPLFSKGNGTFQTGNYV